MLKETEERLFKQYEHLFEKEEVRGDMMKSCMYWGFDVGEGWVKIIEGLLKEIDEEAKRIGAGEEFYFTQIKEKFGSLRAYTSLTSNDIQKIIGKYERLSAKTCEVCGEPGEIKEIYGWYTCFCDKHAREKIAKVRPI
jgi:hypothetical protein